MKKRDTKAALIWITDILKKHSIPFQISGGAAAIAYGASRMIEDIDIDIPEDMFDLVKNEVAEYIIFGPENFKDDMWDLKLMTLKFKGQDIDLGGAYHTKIFNTSTQKWQALHEDLSKAITKNILGLEVPVIPLKTLITYKTALSRNEDLIDIKEIENYKNAMKGKIKIRKAARDDVADVVRMLADDQLGVEREQNLNPIPQQYYAAFDEINADKNNYLIVAEVDDKIIGTLQLTLIPYLTYQGGKRALIEAVRVDGAHRGRGVGKIMLEWAINEARNQGCHMVQLTSDKERQEALEFYKKLGFIPSHNGLKLHLDV